MTTQIEIKARLWGGAINIRIRHHDREYLVRCARMAYFPIYFEEISNYFLLHGKPLWLEYEDVPIRWNLPIGTLYDHLCVEKGVWDLDLQTENYPTNYVIPFNERKTTKIEPNQGDTKDNTTKDSSIDSPTESSTNSSTDTSTNPDKGELVDYISTLNRVLINLWKQASFVVLGTAKPVMSLSGPDTTNLLKAISEHNLTKYELVTNGLFPERCRRIPVRILVQGSDGVEQTPVEPTTILRELTRDSLIPTVQGVEVDLDTNVAELWRTMGFLDGYLYVVMMLLEKT